jgi:histidine triad (HIT) family protein
MAPDCIFCKINGGQIPSPRVYEDDRFFAIRDIRPQAKVHLLVIPKEHVASLEAAFPQSGAGRTQLMGELLEAATRVARDAGLLPNGFRLVLNTNAHGGQTVHHIHAHVLGGEPLSGGFGA